MILWNWTCPHECGTGGKYRRRLLKHIKNDCVSAAEKVAIARACFEKLEREENGKV
jgi:hypothetical protein